MNVKWELVRLKDIAEYFIGLTYAPKDVSENGTIVLRSSNVQNDKLDLSDIVRVNKKIKEQLKVKNGDILMCARNGSKRLVGKTATISDAKEEMTFGTFMMVIRSQFNPYLSYFFISDEFRKQIAGGEHTMINQITRYMLDDVKLLLPPLPEQQRIVALLDEAFAAIAKAKANAEQNLKNAKELFESYLNTVLEKKDTGWVEKKLKEVCAKITDGTHQTPKYFEEGIIFLSSRNVTTGKIDWDNIKYIDEKQHIEMHKRVAPKVGDILLAKNGTTGVAAMVDRDVVFDIYVSLAHIRVIKDVLPEFMLYFINSPNAKSQFNKRLKGIGVPNLHLEEIREVVISFPESKEEQQSIVNQLDALRAETQKLENIYQQKIAGLEELKKSIFQKAFTGELKVEKAVAV